MFLLFFVRFVGCRWLRLWGFLYFYICIFNRMEVFGFCILDFE
jgi:hypothetical protein